MADIGVGVGVIDKNKNNTESHLPESPPDSGSEPPYSPTDLHSLGLPTSLIRHSKKQSAIGTGIKIEQQKNDMGHLALLQHQHHVPLYISNVSNGILPQAMLPAPTKLSVSNQDPYLHQNPDALIDLEPHHMVHRSNSVAAAKRLTYHDLVPTQEIQNLISNSEELTQLLPVVYSQNSTINSSILSPAQHVHHSMHPQQQRMAEEQYYMQHLPPQTQQPQQQYHLAQLDINTNTTTVPLPLSPHPIPIPDKHPVKMKNTSENGGTLTTTKKRKLVQSTSADIQQQISLLVKPEPDNLNTSAQLKANTPIPIPSVISEKNSQLDSGLSSCSSLDNSQLQNIDNPDGCSMQTIRFSPFQQQQWHILCDQSLQEL